MVIESKTKCQNLVRMLFRCSLFLQIESFALDHVMASRVEAIDEFTRQTRIFQPQFSTLVILTNQQFYVLHTIQCSTNFNFTQLILFECFSFTIILVIVVICSYLQLNLWKCFNASIWFCLLHYRYCCRIAIVNHIQHMVSLNINTIIVDVFLLIIFNYVQFRL